MIRVVLVTAPAKEAEELARKLVDEKLIACANLLPGATSIYRWEGKVQSDTETVMIMKTEAKRTKKLIQRIKELHSYDVPEVLVLPVKEGNPQYMRWVRDETNVKPKRKKK